MSALDALARRDHSTMDLCRKLEDRGFDAGTVAQVVERLRDEHLVDDGRYAQNYVAAHAERGQGPLRIRMDLRRLGLIGAVVEEALQSYPDWLVQVRRAHEKKFGTRPATLYADRRRRIQFLSYRGYTGSQIRSGLGWDVDLETDS